MSPQTPERAPAGLEEALLEDPADEEAWSVFGDWLSAQGDPRGELIGLEHALARDRDRRLVLRHNRLVSDHLLKWFKPDLWRVVYGHPFAREHLEAEVRDLASGARSWSALRRLPALLAGADETLVLGAHAGFVSTVSFGPGLQTKPSDSVEAKRRPAAVLRHLLDSPAARLCCSVELGRQDAGAFEKALQRKSARRLKRLGLISHGDDPMGWLARACPALRSLSLGKGNLEPQELADLRELSILVDGTGDGTAVPHGLRAPALRQLRWVGDDTPALAETAKRPWPQVVELTLHASPGALVRSLRVLRGSRLASQLHEIRLRVDGPAAAVGARLDEFEGAFVAPQIEAENLSVSQAS